MDLSGRHALVSGGGTGVGAAVATALVQSGAKVTICGRRSEPLDELASSHDNIHAVTCDVTDEGSVSACVDSAVAMSGPVDIAVANAGAAQAKPFLKMTSGDLAKMLDVNLTGTFNLWRATASGMRENGWGRMIAIASIAGLKGHSYISAYCAAKHGVIGLTRALAHEFATSGITVNAICPGYVETDLLDNAIDNIVAKTGMDREAAAETLKQGSPQNRFIQPSEVAHTVLWLCGDGACSVNGAAIPISGGEV
ncbi:MAG: SDR family NAD(P)-dependent oxidoreductase [Rhizobiaceae bacterium]